VRTNEKIIKKIAKAMKLIGVVIVNAAWAEFTDPDCGFDIHQSWQHFVAMNARANGTRDATFGLPKRCSYACNRDRKDQSSGAKD
jgi:hypothetical protein